MNWKTLTIIGVVLGLAVLPAAAQLCDNPKVVEKLGLSEEQVNQLRSARLEHQKAQIQTRSTIETLGLELRELWRSDQPDEAKIISKTKELAKIRGDAQVENTRHRLAAHGILTPEQRTKVKEFMQKGMQNRRTHRMKAGQGNRQGQGPAGPGMGMGPMQGQGRGQGNQQGWQGGPNWGPPAQGFGPGGPGRGQQPGFNRQGPRRGPGQWGALDSELSPFGPEENLDNPEVAFFDLMDESFFDEAQDVEE